MVNHDEVIKLVPTVMTPSRVENCTVQKLDAIVGIVRAILNEEIDRCAGNVPKATYVGLNIYRTDNRVFYARSYGLEYTEFGPIPIDHFIEFETENDAEVFHRVLNGILMLGLTKFEVQAKVWEYPEPTEEFQNFELTAPTFPWFNKAA
jgi:hypothetical protein